MRIAIVLFDGVEELDFVGPWEVFTLVRWGLEIAGSEAEPPEVFTVSERGGTVRAANGLRVLSDHGFADAPSADVLVVPGGATTAEARNPVMIEWIARAAAEATWVTSVCTGVQLLIEAGPAAGRTVTTHWGYIDELRRHEKAGEVRSGVRWVRDGNLVTAAGVSAGIDMALWLVGEIWSPDVARGTQRGMEYDPAPPYAADPVHTA